MNTVKKSTSDIFLLMGISFVIIISLCYFNATTPLIQKLAINSDQLTIISLADDILKNPHFSVHYWNFPRAPYFFPDLALTVGLKTVVHSDVAVAASMLAIQSAFIVSAGIMLSALLVESAEQRVNAIALYGSLMILAFIGTRHGWYPDAVVWPFISYSHAAALDLTLIGFLALTRNRYAPPARPVQIVLSTAVTTLAYCSDKTAIVLFLPPATLYLFASVRNHGYARFLIFTVIQIIAIFSMIVVDNILYFQIMDDNKFSALQKHIVYVFHFFTAQRVSFQIVIAITVSVMVLVFIKSSITLLSRFNDTIRDETGLLFLLSSSGLINILLCVWLWSGDQPDFARYAVMTEFAGPVLVVWALQYRWSAIWSAKAGLPVLCTMILLSIVSWEGTRNPLEMVDAQRRRGAEFEACIAQNGLHSGFAAYWLARQLSSSTNWNIQVDQFSPTQPNPFFWGSNVIWFFDRLLDGSPVKHDFILLNSLPRDQVFLEYGRPDEIERCGDYTLAIYRNDEKLQERVNFHLASLLTIDSIRKHLPQRVLTRLTEQQLAFGVNDLYSLVGHRENGSVALSPENGPGYGLYGPYISLAAGSYKVDVAFSCSGELEGSYVEIFAGGQQQQMASWKFSDHPEKCDNLVQHAQIKIDAHQNIKLLQVRAYYGGRGNVSILDVQMSRDPGA